MGPTTATSNHPASILHVLTQQRYEVWEYCLLRFTFLAHLHHISVMCLRSHTILMMKQGTEAAFLVLASLVILGLSLSFPVQHI